MEPKGDQIFALGFLFIEVINLYTSFKNQYINAIKIHNKIQFVGDVNGC